MVRALTAAEKKKYAAMTAQGNKLITAQKTGTYNPPKTTGVQTAGGSTLPASMTQTTNGVVTPKVTAPKPPAAPVAPVVTPATTNKSSGSSSRSSGNNRAGGGASVQITQPLVKPGTDPLGAGIKKLDNATGIVSRVGNSKALNTAMKGIVTASDTVKKLNEGYKSQANSPMRQAQNALKDTYLGATGKVDNEKAAQTAKAFQDKHFNDPYKKSVIGQSLGNLGGVTRGTIDLFSPTYSADALARGEGGVLEAFDTGSVLLGGGAVAFAGKVARKAEDFVKLADKAVDIAEIAAKSEKVATAVRGATKAPVPVAPTKNRAFSIPELDGLLTSGGKIATRADNGGLLVEVPKGKSGAGVYNASFNDVKQYNPAEVAKMTEGPKKPADIPAEEKIDTRNFKPGTFKGTADDLTANVKTIYPVRGAKQTNMTQAQKDMLVADRTAARKEAGIKTNTPESKKFNKTFDEKWYAQKGLSPNGGKAKTGDYELTLKDGSKHLVSEKDFPGLDLEALGKGLKGTAGKAADEVRAAKPPAGGPALIKHWVDKVTTEGKTTTTLRNALKKAVDEGKIKQADMDAAIKGFNDAKAPQGPPVATGKLSKAVKAEAEKAKSFYFNKGNDVTFTKVDGSKVQVKAKDMTPEDIILLKKQLEEARTGAKAVDKPENLAKAGTVGKKGQYIPTPEEKVAMDKARVAARQAEEARTGVKFVKKSPEIKEFNKNFDKEYMAKNFGDKVANLPAKAADKSVLADKTWQELSPEEMKLANEPAKAAPDAEAAKSYLAGEDISTPSAKVDPTAPTPKTSPEVEAVTVPPAKGGSAKAAKVTHRGNNPQPEWDATILKQAQSAAKIENAKVGGTKKAGWRLLNKDGVREGTFAKNELSPEVNAQIEALYGTAPATAKATDGVETLAKSDAAPEAITPVKAEEPTLTQPTAGLKAVDDPVEQVAKQVSSIRAAKASDELGGQMAMDLGTTSAKMADEVPTTTDFTLVGEPTDVPNFEKVGEPYTPTPNELMLSPQGVTSMVPTAAKFDHGFNPQLLGGEAPRANVNVNAPGSTKAPGKWAQRAKTAAKVGIPASVIGGIAYAGFKSGPTGTPGEADTAPNTILDDYNALMGGGETADLGGGYGGYGGGGYGGQTAQMPQMGMPGIGAETQAPEGLVDMGDGRQGHAADWYMIDENGQLAGPYEGVIGPDNLTYYQDENGQWQRVPEGAIVDAPNGTDYQRGAGMDDDDPTNDNIYDPENPYIPNLTEIIDPELDQIIEENGGYTVENLMEVYAPYIEMQNAEIDAQVEQEIIALREQLAARGMYNSDVALTLEKQIRDGGEARKQEIYMQMFQQAQELAMEYGYKYAQLGEEQRMNNYEIESRDREFQQAVKEFEEETGLGWAELDLQTQKELFDQFDANRGYNLDVYKASNSGSSGGSSGGGGGTATPATLVKIQNEMLDIINAGTQENPGKYVAGKLATYVNMGYLSDSQARQIAANLGML